MLSSEVVLKIWVRKSRFKILGLNSGVVEQKVKYCIPQEIVQQLEREIEEGK